MSASNQEDDDDVAEDALLLEEARKDWTSRGYKEGDFSVDKMLALWAEEDEKRLGQTDRLATNLRLKMELLEVKKQAEVSPDEILTFIKRKAREAKTTTLHWLSRAKDRYTPEALRRHALWKRYQISVQQDMAATAQRKAEEAAAIDQAQLLRRQRKELREELRGRVLEEEDIRTLAKDSKQMAIRSEKQHRIHRIAATRKQILHDRAQNARRLALQNEQRVSASLHRRRIQDFHRWTEQRKRAEGMMRREAEGDLRAVIVDFDGEEEEHRKILEEEEAFAAGSVSPLFPLKAGRDLSAEEEAELDAGMLHVFNADGVNPRMENLQSDKMEAESAAKALAQKLAALKFEEESWRERKETLQLETRLIQSQCAGINADLRKIRVKLEGPPRREAGDLERAAMDKLVKLQFALRDKVEGELMHEMEVGEQRLKQIRKDIELTAARKAQADESLMLVASEVETRLLNNPQLPVIVGGSKFVDLLTFHSNCFRKKPTPAGGFRSEPLSV